MHFLEIFKNFLSVFPEQLAMIVSPFSGKSTLHTDIAILLIWRVCCVSSLLCFSLFVLTVVFFNLISSKKIKFFFPKWLNLYLVQGNWNYFFCLLFMTGLERTERFLSTKNLCYSFSTKSPFECYAICEQQSASTWNISFFILQLRFRCIWKLHHLWYKYTLHRHFPG